MLTEILEHRRRSDRSQVANRVEHSSRSELTTLRRYVEHIPQKKSQRQVDPLARLSRGGNFPPAERCLVGAFEFIRWGGGRWGAYSERRGGGGRLSGNKDRAPADTGRSHFGHRRELKINNSSRYAG